MSLLTCTESLSRKYSKAINFSADLFVKILNTLNITTVCICAKTIAYKRFIKSLSKYLNRK